MVAQTFSSSTWEAEAGHSVVRGQLSLQSKFRTVRAVTQRSPVSKNSSSKGKPGRIWALSKESSKLVIFYPFFFPTRHTEWTVRNLGKRVRWERHLASYSVFFQFTHHMVDDSRMVSLLKRF